jgi:hypothetical protein
MLSIYRHRDKITKRNIYVIVWMDDGLSIVDEFVRIEDMFLRLLTSKYYGTSGDCDKAMKLIEKNRYTFRLTTKETKKLILKFHDW